MNDKLKLGLRYEQLGLYGGAEKVYREIAADGPDAEAGRFRLRKLQKRVVRVRQRDDASWRLIWQVDPGPLWEAGWLRFMLGGIRFTEHVDLKHADLARHAIIVDNTIRGERKLAYYDKAFHTCEALVLVHLSDEAYADDTSVYGLCDLVVRNYWSFLHRDDRTVMQVPLGWKSGFATPHPGAPAGERDFVWSFAGDAKKSTRQDMLTHMRTLGRGHEHLTSGFGTGDALSVEEYRRLLDRSVFVPCPAGFSNLDSFRVWEAFEAGCIPIVEKRGYLDYFTTLLGPHPIPTVASWDAVKDVVPVDSGPKGWETLRLACAHWWDAYKRSLVTQVSSAITGLA